jgi:ABC-type sugar transport system substrate-binding protein
MKTMTLHMLAMAIVLMVFGAMASAGEKSKAENRTITGCLSQGDDANEFLLKGTDGSTWEVKSNGVALAPHVGHTVQATGEVSHAKMHNLKEDAKEAAKDSGVTKKDTEHGHLKVSDVKMVSDSCQ